MPWYGVEKAANELGLYCAARKHATLVPLLERSDAECPYLWQSRVTSLDSCQKGMIETIRENLHIPIQQWDHKCLHLFASQAGILFVGICHQLSIC